MANRRMFSKDIVRSDAFLDLPISSQALYFHLGMEADDRGYVSNPKTIIRSLGTTIGDLEQLANKKFILIRGEGLVLIKGWRINNYIQNDRFVETKHIDDLKKLFFDENNSYTEKDTKMPCIQNVSKMYTQDSIDKVSLVKDSIVKDSIVEDRIDKHEKINFIHDKPRFTESCIGKLIMKNYISLDDLIPEKEKYVSLFELLLKEYTEKNITISLNYLLKNLKDDVVINNKYSYLATCLNKSCEKFKYKEAECDIDDEQLLKAVDEL